MPPLTLIFAFMENTPTAPKQVRETWWSRDNYLVFKYILLGIILTFVIGVFSAFMAAVASYRSSITASNYDSVSAVYNGALTQTSPSLMALDEASAVYAERQLNPTTAQRYVENTSLVSTNGQVDITADYVKKGLTYQPTYRTAFQAEYTLSNALNEPAAVTFNFPFPLEAGDNEISNATLTVDGKNIPNAKTTITATTDDYDYGYGYDNYYEPEEHLGLKWDGEIPANGSVTVKVTYNTAGLAMFTYEGIDNPTGAQDFHFVTKITGIRSYDVERGLSVDEREFGDNYVQLTWDKPALYSQPTIAVSVGDKVNPSLQVSRIYVVMAPIFAIFMLIVLFLSYKFGRKPLPLLDVFLLSVLFVLFFPLVHYLSSLTVDPTLEVFASFKNVPYFSMPLYGAFAIAWVVLASMMVYLIGRMEGFGFAMKFFLPTVILFLGFFPLVVTVPEYSVLLALLGVVALMVIIVQSRISLAHKQ